jgi:transcriptional regulator with GAF, ATPase, and Fis domain
VPVTSRNIDGVAGMNLASLIANSHLTTPGDNVIKLVEVAESISAHRDLSSLLRDLKKRLHQVVRVDAAQVVLHDQRRNLMRRHAVQSPSPSGEPLITELSIEEAPAGWVWETQQPLLIDDPAAYVSRYPRVVAELREYAIQTTYVLPLTSLGRRLGALVFMSREETAWSEEDLALLRQVTKLVALAVDNVINSETARTAEIEYRRVEQLRLMLLKRVAPPAPAEVSTLEAAERQHILRALEEAHWVVGGANGAAARLGMKRTTLQSKMQKLGLERDKS